MRGKVPKLRWTVFSALLVGTLSLNPIPGSAAVEDCQNLGSEYRKALEVFQASSINSNIGYKDLVNLKKEADRLREVCIKTINNDFKSSLKAINVKYSVPLGTKEEKLTARTKKDNEIAAATLVRDRRMRELASIPQLPQKGNTTKQKKLKP